MDAVARAALVIAAALWALACGGFALISWREGERRAVRVVVAAAAIGAAALLLSRLLPAPVPVIAVGCVGALALATAAFSLAPVGRGTPLGGRPTRRVDERDIMFARARLRPGSAELEAYYRLRPEHRHGDDRTRALPGLLSPDAELADAMHFAVAGASFDITEALRDAVDGEVAPRRVEIQPSQLAAKVKGIARRGGAVAVGVTRVRPYHVYSHVGRGSGTWGEPITPAHEWAIAFAVEMDHDAINHAPGAPAVVESARQYVEAAKIALHIASFLRRCGWPARAHIDGNYRVIAPLVARDAGLGEIGRMGLLMTPRLGPRVRLGVVTTDAPLEADAPGDDATVLDFCTVCRKCAATCPVGAIPSGPRLPIDDGLRWAIDADTCFRYWNAVGTDCGRCMAVCPYSHPDNPAHNLVRQALARSGGVRRAMVWLDDLVYGRRPRPRGWVGAQRRAARARDQGR
jgi:ferredoxin